MPESVGGGGAFFTVDGLDLASAGLDAMAARVIDSRPAMDALGHAILRYEDETWGQGWDEDAQATLDSKDTAEIGVQSGVLKRSVTTRGSRFNVFETTKTSVRVGTTAPVAHLFDKGRKGVRGGAPQPERPLFRITQKQKDALVDRVVEWIIKGRKGAKAR